MKEIEVMIQFLREAKAKGIFPLLNAVSNLRIAETDVDAEIKGLEALLSLPESEQQTAYAAIHRHITARMADAAERAPLDHEARRIETFKTLSSFYKR